MNSILITVWSVLVFLVIYHHVLYPLFLNQVFKKRANEKLRLSIPEELPRITVVVPCYNEEKYIAEKIRNFSFVDYPNNRFNVLLVNDGSTDDTVAIARAVIDESCMLGIDIAVIDHRINRGKVAVINQTLASLDTDIVVLSDTSALISIDAFQRLAGHFTDAKVGVVSATYEIMQSTSPGEQRYWQYQTRVKQCESAMGATLGTHGALYAFRFADFFAIPGDTINDDFILPMSIVLNGKRNVYDTDIVAVELEQASDTVDQHRRRRIAAGNLQQSIRLVHSLHPKHGAVAFNFASGKFLRALMPFILLAIVCLTILLAPHSPLILLAAVVQALLASGVMIRHAVPTIAWPKVVHIIYYLVAGYANSLLGSVQYLLNPSMYQHWEKADMASRQQLSYVSSVTTIAKRLFDVCLASLALLVTLPFWPVVALAIKCDSPGPVFFRQMRIGRAMPHMTELFMMTKFRTMGANAEKDTGAVWATENDPRISRVGRFLRKTRLDELPQLLNVLRGDMSLVGPRPERPGIGRDLENAIPFYAERTFLVTPGITGLAQVSQGYDSCLDDVKNKLLFDHAYALSLSHLRTWVLMDCRVLVKTVWVMVAGRGQ